MSGSLPARMNIHTVVGRARVRATIIWLELRSHQCDVAGRIGKSAMEASMRTKGMSDHQGYDTESPCRLTGVKTRTFSTLEQWGMGSQGGGAG